MQYMLSTSVGALLFNFLDILLLKIVNVLC